MRRPLPSLNALRAFEAVARHLSMQRAAKELHVTAAAVSQQIKSLESYLGRKLLRRQNGTYALTENALAGFRDLQEAFDRLATAVDAMKRGARTLLTVSVEPSLAATWLVPRLHRLKAQHPGLDVLLQASSELADFARDPVDVALRYGIGKYPGLASERFFGEEVFPVCSPQLLRGKHALKKPADLRHHRLLHLQWTPQCGQWPDWAAWLKAAAVNGVDVEKGLRFTEHAMALQAAAEGQGVALGSTALVADYLATKRLVKPFAISMATRFGYHFVCTEERAQEPNIVVFRDWVMQEARQ
ncbi:MAG: transcriptional regulator GcvA [Gammaproteobacteria bacterium]|nr:transcriptional regulator GcvA [Gammaproteobacteria bacterium]